MPVIHGRNAALKVLEKAQEREVPVPIFGTGSFWNIEAILIAAKAVKEKYQIAEIPVTISMTYTYPCMPQAKRITACSVAELGFRSIMTQIRTLIDSPESPYRDITVLPHLDHADPERDHWALTYGTEYLASAMFDAQRFTAEENQRLTAEYVKAYGKDILIEGIMDELPVEAMHAKEVQKISDEDYPERAAEYVKNTGIDFLVADLGTEQQAGGTSNCHYLGGRARAITGAVGKPMLTMHGGSSLPPEQLAQLGSDGIMRFNVWTKIARDAGRYAAFELFKRAEAISAGDFNSIESEAFMRDNVANAAESMIKIFEHLGYSKLA